MIDGKTQPYLSKGFWWIPQKVCGLFNTCMIGPLSKGPCEPYPEHGDAHCSMKSSHLTPLECGGISSECRAAFWGPLSCPLGQRCGGAQARKWKGWSVRRFLWFGLEVSWLEPALPVRGGWWRRSVGQRLTRSPRMLAGTHLLETGQGGSLVWPALTVLAFSHSLVYTCPEDGLQLW